MKKSISSSAYKLFLLELIKARESAGLTQEQFGKLIGKTQSFVSKIERGERRIDLVELIYFCEILRVPPENFIRSLQEALDKEA